MGLPFANSILNIEIVHFSLMLPDKLPIPGHFFSGVFEGISHVDF